MKKHQGDLIIRQGDNTDYSQLEEVTGYLYISSATKLEAPNLTSVGGGLYIYSGAKLEAPNLTSVGGNLYIYSGAKLDNLISVGGYLSINSDAKLDNLISVGGGLSIHSNAKLEAPNLKSVGGNLYIYSGAKLEAPNLKSVGGDLYIHSDAKLDAPFLKGLKYKSIDNYLFIIESEKTKGNITILKGYNAKGVKDNVIVKAPCYVVQSGDKYAHGETIKQAKESLIYKIADRNTDEYKGLTLESEVTFEQGVEMYRKITGSCESMTKQFAEANKFKGKKTIQEIIDITKGQYNNSLLEQFFNK